MKNKWKINANWIAFWAGVVWGLIILMITGVVWGLIILMIIGLLQ